MAGASGPGRTVRDQVLLSGRCSFGLSRIIPVLTVCSVWLDAPSVPTIIVRRVAAFLEELDPCFEWVKPRAAH